MYKALFFLYGSLCLWNLSPLTPLLSWPSSSESAVGPRGELRLCGTWGLAAAGCQCSPAQLTHGRSLSISETDLFTSHEQLFFVFFPCRTWTWFPCRLTGNGRWRLHSLRAVLITPWPWNELWIALIFPSYCKHIDMQGLCVWVDVPAKST